MTSPLPGGGTKRRWRRATLRAIGWYPDTKIGPCYRGHLIVQQETETWGTRWINRQEYTVHALPTGRFGIEHEWSMK